MKLYRWSWFVAVVATVLWAVAWDLAPECKWTGYDDHAMKVFCITFFAALAIKGMPSLITHLRGWR